MNGEARHGFLVAMALVVSMSSCSPRQAGPPSDPRDVIELRWIQSYPRESRTDVETGLLWGLSLLGAKLPQEAAVLQWHDDRVTLDLERARVLEGSQSSWRRLIADLKSSGEYRAHGAIDIGRFLAVALGDPDRYYALTGASSNYDIARGRYRFDDKAAAIVKSAVAHGSRRIDISQADRADQIAFVAFEGAGSLADGSFVAHESELLDVMPNGQLRFALYGLDGRLKAGATPALTTAGKPAKCMWCHESGLQSTFIEFPGAPGFYGRHEFDELVARRRALLDAYRQQLDTSIRYRNLQDHTFMELLYLTFEEPSRERIAAEWGVSVDRAAELLRDKPTHAQAEFSWLGSELYRRRDVDAVAPYVAFAAPDSVREPSGAPP